MRARRVVVVFLLVLAAALHVAGSADAAPRTIATATGVETVAACTTEAHSTTESAWSSWQAAHAHPLPCLRAAQRWDKPPASALRAPSGTTAGGVDAALTGPGALRDGLRPGCASRPTLASLQTLRC